MTKIRSPVLGFNHNIRHRGWLFHVQTEDSGVSNPHIFTHMFREGVIIATRKIVYDASSDIDVVKGLMQAQHKAVLRDLKNGHYDEKIKQYLGEPPEEVEGSAAPSGALEGDTIPVPMSDLPVPGESRAAGPEAASATPTRAAEAPDLFETAEAPAPADAPPAAQEEQEQEQTISAQFPAVEAPAELADELGPFLAALADAPPGQTMHRGSGPGVAASPSAPRSPPSSPSEPRVPERSPRSWVVARPGQPERPFEKSGSIPVVNPPADAPPRQGPPAHHLPEVPVPPSAQPARRISRPPPPAQSAPAPTARRATPAAGTTRQGPAAAPRPAGSAPPRASGPVAAQREPSSPVRENTQPGARAPAAPARRDQAPLPASQAKPDQASVVVARPAVVIGAPPTVIGAPPTPPARRTNAPHARELTPQPATAENIFGQDLISEKSLDEVIMAYLSEDSGDE